jgi:hypothetical protein
MNNISNHRRNNNYIEDMKTFVTDFSMSISLFIVFLLFYLLEYLTMSGVFLENLYWNRSFFLYKIATFIIFGCTTIFTLIIHKGSPFTRHAHVETHEKLDKILKYLEINDKDK